MLLDSGILEIYHLTNTAEVGEMPKETLTLVSRHWFAYQTVGINRYYIAAQAQKQVDLLVRIWLDRSITTDQYCQIDKNQYRIIQVQHLLNDDGLQVTDISLERLNKNYDII